jgi:SAM-dependent methyltransferase
LLGDDAGTMGAAEMSEPTPPQPVIDATTIRDTAMAFQRSRVLLTAVELGVFAALAAGPRSSAEVAAGIGADGRATDRLLNALSVMGFVEKPGGVFALTAASRRYLVANSPEFQGGLGHSVSMWHAWSGLTEAVRLGAPTLHESINERGEEWLEPFIAAMHHRASQQADRVAALIGLEGVTRVLDVGGGSGAFAMAFARQSAGLTAVVYDLPNVVPLTARYIEAAGLSGRVTTEIGDYLADNLPGGFDLVFLSAVVHSNAPDENAALVRKCAASLRPGGRLAVVDFVMDDTRTSPPVGAFFALNMLVATDHGDTFTESEIGGWLAAAGLEVEPRIDTPFGTGIMVGHAHH